MLRNLTDIFPGLRWTTSNNGRTATTAIPLAGPIELSLTSAGSIAMRLPEDGLFKKELTLSPDSAVAYLDRWAADHYAAIESAMGLRPRAKLEADLAALRERMRWRDVRVELPDEDTAVEVFTGDNTVTTMWLEHGRLEDENGVQFGDGFITHWRPIDVPEPLPAAPEVQNG